MVKMSDMLTQQRGALLVNELYGSSFSGIHKNLGSRSTHKSIRGPMETETRKNCLLDFCLNRIPMANLGSSNDQHWLMCFYGMIRCIDHRFSALTASTERKQDIVNRCHGYL